MFPCNFWNIGFSTTKYYKKYSTNLSLHSYNIVGLTLYSLKKKDENQYSRTRYRLFLPTWYLCFQKMQLNHSEIWMYYVAKLVSSRDEERLQRTSLLSNSTHSDFLNFQTCS